jgi:hypothetical protein
MPLITELFTSEVNPIVILPLKDLVHEMAEREALRSFGRFPALRQLVVRQGGAVTIRIRRKLAGTCRPVRDPYRVWPSDRG